MQSSSPVPEPRTETIQVGRQAIFDRDLEVFAYEILYRDEKGNCLISDGDQASSVTLLNAFMEIGLERIAGPHKAFVNLTRHFFVNMPPISFHQQDVVLEVLEDVQVDELLLQGIADIKAQGYQLALDDYRFQPELAPILPLVRYIKVEITADGMDELEQRMPELRATGAKLLAEKVETAEQFDQLKAMGFDYFQGYFFARPNLVQSERVGENSAMVMQLLARLNDPDVFMNEIVELVSQDPGLSFKVLRWVNSAAIGLRARVESIQRAVVLMGLARIRAWTTLFAMAGLGSRPIEILNLGLLRANLCERLCRLCATGVPETAYTVGLLSVLDAMMSRPMEGLVNELPLSDDVKRALTHHEGTYGRYLGHTFQMERNEYPQDTCKGITAADLAEAYLASSEAAFTTIELLKDD
jgi:EAL and modified HD-GYP domain-containing signal transduction protein